MNNENVENGLTFKEIFSFIGLKKIASIVTTIVILIITFLGLFFINSGKSVYECEFLLQWDGIEENRYPNGNNFNYNDIISSKNIDNIISNNKNISYLNSDKILEKGKTKLRKSIEYIDKDNTDLGYITKYYVSSNKSNFKSREDAKLFFYELINLQYNKAITNIENSSIDNYLKALDSKSEYNVIFDALDLQIDYLETNMKNLIGKKSNSFTYKEQATLQTLDTRFKNFVTKYKQSGIKNEFFPYHYVRDVESAKIKFQSEIASIQYQIEQKTLLLEKLKKEAQDLAGSSTIIADAYFEAITPIHEEINKLNSRLDYISEKDSEGNLKCNSKIVFNPEYDSRVNSYITSAIELTNEINDANIAVKKDDTRVFFENNDIVATKDSMSILVITAVSVLSSVVLTFLIDLIWLLIVRNKSNKQLTPLNNNENQSLENKEAEDKPSDK